MSQYSGEQQDKGTRHCLHFGSVNSAISLYKATSFFRVLSIAVA